MDHRVRDTSSSKNAADERDTLCISSRAIAITRNFHAFLGNAFQRRFKKMIFVETSFPFNFTEITLLGPDFFTINVPYD